MIKGFFSKGFCGMLNEKKIKKIRLLKVKAIDYFCAHRSRKGLSCPKFQEPVILALKQVTLFASKLINSALAVWALDHFAIFIVFDAKRRICHILSNFERSIYPGAIGQIAHKGYQTKHWFMNYNNLQVKVKIWIFPREKGTKKYFRTVQCSEENSFLW